MAHTFDTPVARGTLVRMAARKKGEPGFVDEAEVDTIEMELRPEDLARLAQIPGVEALLGDAAEGIRPANSQAPAPNGPASGAAARSERVQAIQAELAAGLEPRPADTPPSLPPAAPATDAPAAQAKKAPVSPTDAAQISKPRPVSFSPPAAAPVSKADPPISLPIFKADPPPVSAPASLAPKSIVSPARTAGLVTPSGAVRAADPAPSAATPLKRPHAPAPTPSSASPIKVLRSADTTPVPATSTNVLRSADVPTVPAMPIERTRGAASLWVALLGLFALGAAAVWLSGLISSRAENPVPPTPTRAPIEAVESDPGPPPVAAAPEARTIPAGDVVKVRNPFDAGEVFEFPTGTSPTDARQAVAEFLLQRACTRRGSSTATACGEASTPADLLRDSSTEAQ